MDVYIYRAALLCESCGVQVREDPNSDGVTPENPDDENTYDSDDYPKGPYPNGGGESDTPQHCDICEIFLENPLTDEGVQYVREMVNDYRGMGEGDENAIGDWLMFYEIT